MAVSQRTRMNPVGVSLRRLAGEHMRSTSATTRSFVVDLRRVCSREKNKVAIEKVRSIPSPKGLRIGLACRACVAPFPLIEPPTVSGEKLAHGQHAECMLQSVRRMFSLRSCLPTRPLIWFIFLFFSSLISFSSETEAAEFRPRTVGVTIPNIGSLVTKLFP